MHIGLDIRYVNDHFPGIGRYVAGLATALAEIDHGHTLVLLHNPMLPNTRYNLAPLRHQPNVEITTTTARPFTLAEQVDIPRLARRLKLDLLHSPYYIKPYFGLPCPSVVTIYDVIGRHFPRALPNTRRFLFTVTMHLAVRTATRLITISQSARDDIAYFYGLPRERIAVTPLAADQRFQPQAPESIAELRRRAELPSRYVLYFGSNKPHKNLERLIRAWERFRENTQLTRLRTDQDAALQSILVIAGHYDPRYPEARQMTSEQKLSSSVRFLQNVAEKDLPALYSGAEAFIFPSYYEGFGLPPLEAMACGTPVICAYASSLPEVVDDAALTIDPFNFIEIAAALQQLLSNRSLRARLRERGLRRASAFSWRRMAQETLQVYEEAARR